MAASVHMYNQIIFYLRWFHIYVCIYYLQSFFFFLYRYADILRVRNKNIE
jgi:uncharacterized membrane protein